MTEEQFKAMMLQLESIAHNLKLITDHLTTPLVVNNVLSPQELDSLNIDSGFYVHPGLRNQDPPNGIRATQHLLSKTIDNMFGRGYSLDSYRKIMLETLKVIIPEMTMVQMESTVLTYTGNSIESHWENQAGADPDQSIKS